MFHVGDKVRAFSFAPYTITTDGWTGYVTRVRDDEIWVSQQRTNLVDESNNFMVEAYYFELVEPASEKKKEEIDMNLVKEIITDEERSMLLDNMKSLLNQYNYRCSDEALNKIIDVWATNKAELISAFKKHANYIPGKFMIAFDHDFSREIDKEEIVRFKQWILSYDTAMAVREFMPKDMRNHVVDYGIKLPSKIYGFIHSLPNCTEQYIGDEIVSRLNEICPSIHAHKGQKMSRVVNKLLGYIGYDKLPIYNSAFAKYADALNPLKIKRHTVLSVNPLDYLTMSFGNSWASCHTIDKENKRNMPNSYEGMYSSGTVSYMLDSPSMVFYTVDASYNGNDFWNEPKINRQMFHWGEEKLIQGRLYPQDNDGNNSAYTPHREIVQSIMSELFDFPNIWTLSRGTGSSAKYAISEGTHYRDYECYDNCTLSRPKGSENEECITIGHSPICIKCGEEHDVQGNISCCANKITCAHCGCEIDEDDAIFVDGEYYCNDCVFWCDRCDEYHIGEGTRVRGFGTVCSNCIDNFYHCAECGEYVTARHSVWMESEDAYFCDTCVETNFAPCERCGELHRFTDMKEIAGMLLCRNCTEEDENETEN
jgi:hypothetical protein